MSVLWMINPLTCYCKTQTSKKVLQEHFFLAALSIFGNRHSLYTHRMRFIPQFKQMLCKYTQGFDVTCQKLFLNSCETKFFAVPEQKISTESFFGLRKLSWILEPLLYFMALCKLKYNILTKTHLLHIIKPCKIPYKFPKWFQMFSLNHSYLSCI